MELISVMVPCYNEEESLPLFRDEILRVMSLMPEYAFEVIFADDGSKDGTLRLLREYAAADERFRYVSFTRNFGKEAAMYALLQASTVEDRISFRESRKVPSMSKAASLYLLISSVLL